MRASLDIATDPWGIKVNRVELKNIIPPAAIQDAMEKQMKAERAGRRRSYAAKWKSGSGKSPERSVSHSLFPPFPFRYNQ